MLVAAKAALVSNLGVTSLVQMEGGPCTRGLGSPTDQPAL